MIEQLEIDRSRSKSADGQLVEFFQKRIMEQILLPGDRLPTSRDIVSKIGVSSQTVRQAIKKLEQSGLVEAIPGRGTFVTNNVLALIQMNNQTDKQDDKSVKLIGLRNLVDLRGLAFSDEFHSETARGFFTECNKLNLISTTFPYSPDISKKIFLELVKKAGCDGMIWQVPDNKDIACIDHLVENNIPVVVTGYSNSIDKYPMVQSDNQKALYNTVEYFASNGCEQTYLFTYFDVQELKIVDLSLPIGLKHRLEESYEIITGKAAQRVQSFNGSASGEGFSDVIMKVLYKAPLNTGLVFASAWQFYRLLVDKGEQALELLNKHKIAVMGNRCFLVKLLPLVKDLNFYIIVTSPEKMASAAVNKLASIIDGYNSENSEIIPAEFMNFRDMNFMDVIGRYYLS